MNIQFQKVIDGLQHHAGIADWGCWKDKGEEHNYEEPPNEYCPYYDDEDNGEPACGIKLLTDAITLLKEYDSALRAMVYQYCVDSYESVIDIPERFNHNFMSAGEEAFRVLGIKNGEKVPEDWLRW